MTTSSIRGAVATKASPVTTQFQFGPWSLTAVKSHILESEGSARHSFESELELPQVPEMVFADNVLRVQHANGSGVEFNALDALKLVDAHHDPLKVAVSQAWKEARADCEHINEVIKPFDWTFTTDYKGTLIGNDEAKLKVIGILKDPNPVTLVVTNFCAHISDSICWKVEQTDERIDMEKLKVREKIHFYEDILLFEDELSDNGTSLLNVKIRVMPTSFFILLRQFMRVDNVIVRVLDTRLYHEAEKAYMLREHSCRDSKVEDIKAPAHVVTNPNEVAQLIPVRTESYEKLVFPNLSTNKTEVNDAIR